MNPIVLHGMADVEATGRRARSRTLIAAAVICIGLALPAAAVASGPDSAAVADQIAEAVDAVGAAPTAENPAAEVPASGSGLASLALGGAGSLAIDLPAKGAGHSEDGLTTVYDATAPEAAISVAPTSTGLRALITIDGPFAPERYAFPISGDVTSLQAAGDGSVVAYNPDGAAIATLAAPWAVDADGTEVPTHFEIEGTTVVQVVEHRGGGFVYGITADPWWNPFSWNWSKIGRALVSGLTRCGGGALKGALGIGGSVVTVNVIMKGAGTYMVRAAGGPYVYVTAAVAGCIQDLL